MSNCLKANLLQVPDLLVCPGCIAAIKSCSPAGIAADGPTGFTPTFSFVSILREPDDVVRGGGEVLPSPSGRASAKPSWPSGSAVVLAVVEGPPSPSGSVYAKPSWPSGPAVVVVVGICLVLVVVVDDIRSMLAMLVVVVATVTEGLFVLVVGEGGVTEPRHPEIPLLRFEGGCSPLPGPIENPDFLPHPCPAVGYLHCLLGTYNFLFCYFHGN